MVRISLLFAGLLVASTLPAIASPFATGPIPIRGGGSFDYGWPGDGGYSFSASGTNGVDSVSVNVGFSHNFIGPFVISGSFSGGHLFFPFTDLGSASINGFSSNRFLFSMGYGDGFVSVYDSSDNLLATATVIAYVETTSVTDVYFPSGGTIYSRSGSFSIEETGTVPEPALGGAVAVICFVFAWRRRYLNHRARGES